MLTHCEVLSTISNFIEKKCRLESEKAQIVRELTAQQKTMEEGMPELKRLLNLGKLAKYMCEVPRIRLLEHPAQVKKLC